MKGLKNPLKRLGNFKSSENIKKIFHKVLFSIFNLFPVNNKKIVFITLHSNNFSGNNKKIYDELSKRELDLTYRFYSMEDIKLSNLSIFNKLMKSILIDYNVCTARYVIINDYYSLFSMVKIRKGTDLIQVWHAGGAFKKFGLDSLRNLSNKKLLGRASRGHSQYTKVIVSSKEVAPIYASAFGVDINNIFPIGIPRADVFFYEKKMEKIRSEFFERYPYLKNKKIILYAPTFRDDNRYNSELKIDIDYLFTNISKGYVLIFKLHPFERGKVKIQNDLSEKVFDLSNEEINNLLIVTDLLITDYSSLIFEYAILNKTMIFFAYDLEKYENELRGFYYPYVDFVPGPIAYTTEEIVEYIKKDEWDFEQIREFAMRFNEHFDGKATERFIDEVLFENTKHS